MTLKRLILLIAITLMAMSALAQYEDEIVWLKNRSADWNPGYIQNAIFTPDEKSIIVSGTEKCFELDAMTGEVIREIKDFWGAYKFSDDDKYVYTYDFKKVNYQTGEVVKDYPVKKFYDFDINEKAGIIVGTSLHQKQDPWQPGGVIITDLNTATVIKEVGVKYNYYYSVEISGDGKYFVTGSEQDSDLTKETDNTDIAMIWNAKTFDTVKSSSELGVIKLSPDGKLIASGRGAYVRVFDAKTWEKKYEWAPGGQYGANRALDFTPDSKYLATAGAGGGADVENISIWDMKTGELSYRYHNYNKIQILKLFYSKDGQFLLAFSQVNLGVFRTKLTGIDDSKQKTNTVLYPNPTTGEFIFISSNLKPGLLHIDLTDLQGNIISSLYDGTYNNEELKFNISSQPDGSYFLKTIQEGNSYMYKVIKEK
jgi:WD40 repeat protein